MSRASDRPSPDLLEVEASHEGDAYCVRLIGELDLAGCKAAEEALLQAEESEAGAILLDIDGLRFIDSTGLSLLLRTKRRDDDAGRRLRVTRGNGHVSEMLRVTRLDRVLPFA